MTANEWLLANGHNNGGRCEKCWSEARLRGEFDSVTDAYHAVMEEWQERACKAVGMVIR